MKNLRIHLFYQLLIGIFLSSMGIPFIHANSPVDTIQGLPQKKPGMVSPIHKPTKSGKHPSEYSFSIPNPSNVQIGAWQEGDFEKLQGIHVSEVGLIKSKKEFFENAAVAVSTARNVIDTIQKYGSFIASLDGGDLISLPVGLRETLEDGTEFHLGVNKIWLHPTHAQIEVYVKLKLPNWEKALYLGAPDIKFSRAGGLIGDVSVGLLGDFEIPLWNEKGALLFKSAVVDAITEDFKIGVGTYAFITCTGLDEVNVDAKLAFSRDVILPVVPKKDSVSNDTIMMVDIDSTSTKRVELEFGINLSDGLNQIFIELNVNRPFAFAKKKDVIWTLEQVVIDLSETRQSSSFSFPLASSQYDPLLPDIKMWKGVYISKFSVKLPDDFFSSGNGVVDIEQISASEVLIDKNGFTGFVEIDPVFHFGDENLAGWYYSMDYFSIQIITNDVSYIGFHGKIQIPLVSENDDPKADSIYGIEYGAYLDIEQDIYQLSVSPTEDIERPVKMLHAKIILKSTSTLTATFGGGADFEISANLNGSFKIDGSDLGDGKILNIPNVTFNDLEIASRTPFIRNGGSWGVSGSIGAKFKGFSLNIGNIAMTQGEEGSNEAVMRFTTDIELGGGSVDISAGGAFQLVGNIVTNSGGGQNWKYDRLKIDMLYVQAETKSFAIDGYVVFFEDLPEYGDGFQGKLSMYIAGLTKEGEAEDEGTGSVEIVSLALFGSTLDENGEPFRYFMVDALAKFSDGLIPMGPISLRGIGGGVYFRMKQGTVLTDLSSPADFEAPEVEGEEDRVDYVTFLHSFIGQSLSGVKYEPDNNVQFGINFRVVIATSGDEESFNANINFNVQINSDGGIDHILMDGLTNVMAPISWIGPACDGLSIASRIEYVFNATNHPEFTEKGFYAYAHIFLNYEMIKGANQVNTIPTTPINYQEYLIQTCGSGGVGYAGSMTMQFSENTWFINIGTPDVPISVEVDFKIAKLNVGSYFDIGNAIPPFPGLPPNVANLTGLGNILTNESVRSSGQGFAFGANFELDLLDINWAIFHANIGVGAGFDIFVQKFNDAVCVNNNNESLGFNNWYAAGQAYAFVNASIGIGKWDILNLALAAAIQLKAPNPTYGRGAVGGKYRILGGLIKGNCHFQFEFGKECELADGGELELDIDVVATLAPDDAAVEIPTEVRPYAAFAFPVGPTFQLNDPNTGEAMDLQIIVTEFELTLNGNLVAGEVIQEGDYFMEFAPEEMLLGDTLYEISITAELRHGSEILEIEEFTHTFRTDIAWDILPEVNVEYAYPANGQFNYYKDQSATNYIQLVQGQDYLFNNIPTGKVAKVKISSSNPETSFYRNFSYDDVENRIAFSLPASLLNPGRSYRLELVHTPSTTNTSSSSSSSGVGGGPSPLAPELDERFWHSLDNNLPEPEEGEIILYTGYFRASKYNTFEDKISAASFASIENNAPHTPYQEFSEYLSGIGKYASIINDLSEPFGIEELNGLNQNDALINTNALLGQTPWMNKFYNIPVEGAGNVSLYDYNSSLGCNPSNLLSDDRKEVFGTGAPADAVFIYQPQTADCKITEDNILSFNEVYPDSPITADSIYATYMVFNAVTKDIQVMKAENTQELPWYELWTGAPSQEVELAGQYCCGNAQYCTCAPNGGNPIVEDCPDMIGCCNDNPTFSYQMRNLYQNFFEENGSCMRIFKVIPSSICSYLTDISNTTLGDRDKNGPVESRLIIAKFLTAGTYPIEAAYTLPNESTPDATVQVDLERE